jgi:hypothetical protein
MTNTVGGTVTDGQRPLAGVTVTTNPGHATATTAGAGAFSLPPLDIGVYDLSFHLAGFVDEVRTVAVPAGAPVTVSVMLAREGDGGAGGPAVTVSDQPAVGYATAVTVPAQASGNGPFTYAWTQTSGPSASLSGTSTPTLAFTTRDFVTSFGPRAIANARFDVLGIDPDHANEYAFQLVVTDANGLSTTVTVAVSSTRPATGLRMVPTGVPVWLQGNGPLMPIGSPPAPQTSWSWALDTSGASGSVATLGGASSQFPHFTPDVIGKYVVTETVAGQTMSIYAGTWQGEMTAASQANCSLCHTGAIAPDMFTPWKKTAHASAMERKIDGSEGQGFTEACLPCHTVGYDRGAKNNGFDDVEATSGWSPPAPDQPGNWAALEAVPGLGQLAGIQCESCHGPQATTIAGPHANATNLDVAARIKWSTAVCATCHQEGPSYYKAAQWTLGAHADLTLPIGVGSVENSPNAADCGRCHAAQGFARYAAGLARGYYGYLTNDGDPLDTSATPRNHVATASDMTGFGMGKATVEAQSCPACHDPHDATRPAQLRIYDAAAALPNGLTNVSGMGAGMICLGCHSSSSGEHTDFATQAAGSNGALAAAPLSSFTAPHAAVQGDVLFGFNAYFGSRLDPSRHLAVADTCAGCHYAVATASEQAAQQTTNHSFVVDTTVCTSCHAAGLDAGALQAKYRTELDQLRNLFAAKTLAPIAAALVAAPGATLVARAYDPATGLYSSVSASTLDVIIGAAPTAVTFTPIAATPGTAYGPSVGAGLTLALPAPVTVQWVDTRGNPVGAPVPVSNLTVPISSLALPPPASGPQLTPFNAPSASAADVQILYKAYWNITLLNDDNTLGIHNPSFYDAVFAGTTAQLSMLP